MNDPTIRGWRLLLSRLGHGLMRLAGDGPHVASRVECRICGHRHGLVIPADSECVRVTVSDTQCPNCWQMTCDSVEAIP